MKIIDLSGTKPVYEVHLWNSDYEDKDESLSSDEVLMAIKSKDRLGTFDEFFRFKDEDSARKLYNQITDYKYKILMEYDGNEGDVLLEYDNHDPHENMGHRGDVE